MKLTYNISAIIANNQLKSTENRLAKSTERLSSGYKINSSEDDPAGLAIAKKLRAQIKGLENASQNALDGVSVLQSAEGALEEINTIVQRMRELTIQSLNGTYADGDRESIQLEVDSLTEEIDRLVRDTEFNGQTLLNGNMSYRGFTDSPSVTVSSYSKNVASQNYAIEVLTAPEKAIVQGAGSVGLSDPVTAAEAGTITINGVEVEIEEGDTADEVYEKLRNGAKIADVNLYAIDNTTAANTYTDATRDSAGYTTVSFANNTTTLLFVSEEYGSDTHVNISCENATLLAALGLDTLADADGNISEIGVDAEVKLDIGTGFSTTATYAADGDEVTITDRNGFEINLTVQGDTLTRMADDPTLKATVNIEATGMGSMILQIGANQGQTIDIVLPDVSVKALGLDNLNMIGEEGLNRSLTAIDDALTKIQSARSTVGTYQNRLESADSSIDATSFNLEEAFSRIMDTDMAEEMTNYTKENVLMQAGTSILAQANDQPQTVLQLLS
ncbi:flagellin N-terminal helical domain-containing protein [Konateibacter massiliensis]|uniref:flagellin N-terminal helical domain-containing protein n=1 Tax=Konateibacter massiliensis TaxID=2002841 RepID=UPI000C149DB2|nr:flagellin [Konateibacter massiliensis]